MRLSFLHLLVGVTCIVPAAYGDEGYTFVGACDASAAIEIGENEIAVADDEDKKKPVRRYKLDAGAPVDGQSFIVDDAGVSFEDEIDLEGAAIFGEQVFWIGSHSRNAKGKVEAYREKILRTKMDGSNPQLVDTHLLEAVLEREGDWTLGLSTAIGTRKDPAPACTSDAPCPLAPEQFGFSIEGFAYVPPLNATLIGLRNPGEPQLPDGNGPSRAILLRLENLQAVVDDSAPPILGDPILLDLRGRHVRDLAWWPERERLLILAGSKDNTADFRLYSWNGDETSTPTLLQMIDGMSPEAVVPLDATRLLLLSDDGDNWVAAAKDDCKKDDFDADGFCPCKKLKASEKKSFGGRLIEIMAQ